MGRGRPERRLTSGGGGGDALRSPGGTAPAYSAGEELGWGYGGVAEVEEEVRRLGACGIEGGRPVIAGTELRRWLYSVAQVGRREGEGE
jgi:hypothetical protein